MPVLDESASGEGEDTDDAFQGPRSMTALSILESLADQESPSSANAVSDPEEEELEDSLESLADRSERLTIQDDVFELEGLDEVSVLGMLSTRLSLLTCM